MISSDHKKAWLSCKKLSELFKNKNSKHNGGFYRFNCLYSFRTKKM